MDESGGKEVASAIGDRARFVRVDVSRSDEVQAMLGAAVEAFGGLDVLVNNAGFSHRSMPMQHLPEEDFDRVFATNVRGVFLRCKYAIPLLRERGGGSIVNTASIGALRPRPGVTAYNATKGAVLTLTRGLAAEVARYRIRVNAVNPVAAATAFMKGALGVEDVPREAMDRLAETIPLGRLTEPRDVAAAVLFLASDDADFLTGVCLDIDGGRSIQ